MVDFAWLRFCSRCLDRVVSSRDDMRDMKISVCVLLGDDVECCFEVCPKYRKGV